MSLHQACWGYVHREGGAPWGGLSWLSASRNHPFWAASHNPANLPCCLQKTCMLHASYLQGSLKPDNLTVQHQLGHKGNASLHKWAAQGSPWPLAAPQIITWYDWCWQGAQDTA